MTIIDKHNLLPDLRDVTLELGCGDSKKSSQWIGIDAADCECVDIVGDIYDVLKEISDKSINEVHSYHFFEHVKDIELLMGELGRILKPKGQLEVVVPHFSNPYFYSDLTHRNFFGLYSFSYLSSDKLFRRKVPNYYNSQLFDLCDVKLIFKSAPPFYGRYILKRLLQLVFNLNSYTKEFYEENCCYIFPCYEIQFSLRRKVE